MKIMRLYHGIFALRDAAWSRVRRAAQQRGYGAGKVSPRQTESEFSSTTLASRGREARRDRLAHVPPYVPFVTGRDRSSDEGTTGIDASCVHPDDDEYLWTGHVVIEERSEWEGRRDGAQASYSERLKTAIFLVGSLWEFVSRVRIS